MRVRWTVATGVLANLNKLTKLTEVYESLFHLVTQAHAGVAGRVGALSASDPSFRWDDGWGNHLHPGEGRGPATMAAVGV